MKDFLARQLWRKGAMTPNVALKGAARLFAQFRLNAGLGRAI
jgi:hypothetical protein